MAHCVVPSPLAVGEVLALSAMDIAAAGWFGDMAAAEVEVLENVSTVSTAVDMRFSMETDCRLDMLEGLEAAMAPLKRTNDAKSLTLQYWRVSCLCRSARLSCWLMVMDS